MQCSLDTDGMGRQRARYAALTGWVVARERAPGRLEVRFGEGVDEALLREAVEVERACCPFFTIGLDGRTAVFTVSEPEHDPGLDAIDEALHGDAPDPLLVLAPGRRS
jgi:hypothetical protein